MNLQITILHAHLIAAHRHNSRRYQHLTCADIKPRAMPRTDNLISFQIAVRQWAIIMRADIFNCVTLPTPKGGGF